VPDSHGVIKALEALGVELSVVEDTLASVSGRVVAIDLTLEEMQEMLGANTEALTLVQKSLGRLHDLVAEALDRTPPAAQARAVRWAGKTSPRPRLIERQRDSGVFEKGA
jgi:hypothetical protein